MKKLLFLTSSLPYPPRTGGTVKTFRMLKYLSNRFRLSLACLIRKESLPSLEKFRLQIDCNPIYAWNPSRNRNVANLLSSYAKAMPLSIFRNYSKSFARKVFSVSDGFDILFLDSYLMFPYVPPRFRGKIVLHCHNAEHLVWDKFASLRKNPIGRTLLSLEARRVKKYERDACTRAHRVLAAVDDLRALRGLGIDGGKFRETRHLGDDGLLALPNMEYENTKRALLFVGALSWEPNADGLLWFLRSVWRRLVALHPDLTFQIVGPGADRRLESAAKNERNVALEGYVEDLEPYFRASRVFVAPLRFGGGMKVKIVNAMYRGIPFCTTSAGIENMGFEMNQFDELVARDAGQMVRAVDRLLVDREFWKDTATKVRAFAKDHYDWRLVLEKLGFSLSF